MNKQSTSDPPPWGGGGARQYLVEGWVQGEELAVAVGLALVLVVAVDLLVG